MIVHWKKMGRIFAPTGEGFFKSHAARPIPYRLSEDVIRLFFSSRDYDDRMLPTYIDVSANDPSEIIEINQAPLAELGPIGSFDDSGITLACLIEHNGTTYIFYTGWKRRRVVPFELSIGAFSWSQSRNFERLYPGPILAQDKDHPFLVAGPFVLYDEGRFKMWYCSGTEWRSHGDNPEPIYTVFYAESHDAINWHPRNKAVIQYKFDGEVVSAPWVIRIRDGYHMWYSTRDSSSREAKNYVIGYAESSDGIEWTRYDDQAGITRSESGWDSEMICYPAFFPYQEKIYMFYSGNNVGRGGIGYAVADNFLL
jgi:hypothetical protein